MSGRSCSSSIVDLDDLDCLRRCREGDSPVGIDFRTDAMQCVTCPAMGEGFPVNIDFRRERMGNMSHYVLHILQLILEQHGLLDIIDGVEQKPVEVNL